MKEVPNAEPKRKQVFVPFHLQKRQIWLEQMEVAQFARHIQAHRQRNAWYH